MASDPKDISKDIPKDRPADAPKDGPLPAQPAGWGLLWLDLRLGFAFLTRLPVAGAGDQPERKLAEAAWTFPVVGVVVGLASGVGLWVGLWLGFDPLASALLGVAASIAVTGALHEDGLADVADGFGGGADKGAKLRIMRDSRIGTYGVLALLIGVGLRVTLVAGMIGPGTAVLALVAAGVLSRALLPVMMHVLPPARRSGLAAAAGRPERGDVALTLLLGVGATLGLLGVGPGIAALLAAASAYVAIHETARRQIGGHTGDVLGALQQAVEIFVLASVATATVML